MSEIKQADVVYVPEIPAERSGIGRDVPAHVKLQWRDELGRKCSHVVSVSDFVVREIGRLPAEISKLPTK